MRQSGFILLFILFLQSTYAQDVNTLDSLKLKLPDAKKGERLKILERIAFNETHPDSIIFYSTELISESKSGEYASFNYAGLLYLGDGHRLKGEYDLSFKAYFAALDLSEKQSLDNEAINCRIADTYSMVGDKKNSTSYYWSCLSQLKEAQKEEEYSIALFNMGDNYLKLGNIDSAEYYNSRAEKLFKKQDDQFSLIYTSGNAGLIEAEKSNYVKAEENLNFAIEHLREYKIYDAIAEYLLGMSDVLLGKGETWLALEYAHKALEESHKGDYSEMIKESSLKLSEIYEELNQSGEAFSYLKQYMAFRDKLQYESAVQKMEQIRNAYENEKRDRSSKELDLKELKLVSEAPVFYAVLIGVNDYSYNDEVLLDLNQPKENVQSLYQTLTSNYQFTEKNTMMIEDATRADIINTFEMLSQTISEKDNLLIFFAGHGTFDKKLSLGYWLPSDAKSTSKANWVSNSTVRDYIAGLPSKHTLLISDACFSGSIFKSRSLEAGLDDYAISKLYKQSSRKAMTSGSLEIVPDESVFIKYLIKSLNENEQSYISAKQLFGNIEPAVLNNTQNIPQYGIMQNTGDEGGEFIFIRKD